jgi:DNA-binding GntR family transcriptional regulator
MDQADTLPESTAILRKRSLTDEVYEYLSSKIIAGKYASGDWLRQEDISTLLGVSQTPVREALDRLVASGLAERVPYRGVRVPVLEAKDIVDAFLLRLILETTGARLAAEIVKPEEVHNLSTLVEKTANLVSLEDISNLRQLNKEFHSRLVQAAGSPLLSKLYEITTNAFPDWMLYEYMFRHPELLQTSLRSEYLEHKSIVKALAAKDPEAIAYHVATHIKNLWHDVHKYLEIPDDLIQEIDKQIMALFPNHTLKNKKEGE